MEINGKEYSHWEIRDILSKELDIKDRSYHFKTYKSCFIGKIKKKLINYSYVIKKNLFTDKC